MSRKIFDKNLFLEGMRQNRVQGFLYLFLLMLYSVMNPIWRFLTHSDIGGVYILRVISLTEINPALYLVMFLFGALLMAHVFRFLHQRNSSDFYHAIPQTRTCLFVSFFASAVAWMTILLVLPAVTGAILFAVQTGYFKIQIVEIIRTLFHLWLGSLYIMSIVAVALSLTGTMFSCVIVSCMICFLPRLYFAFVEQVVGDELPMAIGGMNLIPGFSINLNIPLGTAFGTVYEAFGRGGDQLSALVSWQSLAYTGSLTILFILVAGWLFNKKKSESAASASNSRFLQGVFRFLAAFTASLIPFGLLFSETSGGKNWKALESEQIFWIVVLYILVLVVYFVYELVTTRKWKNLPLIIPGILFIFIADACVFFGMMKLQQFHASFEPSPEEITSVSVLDTFRNYESNNYFSARIDRVEMESQRAKELVSNGLSRTLEEIRQYGYLRRNSSPIKDQNVYYTEEAAIRVGGQVYYRYITLTGEEQSELEAEMGKDPGLKAIIQDLPAKPVAVSLGNLSEEEAMVVYQAAREEIAGLPFEKAYSICMASRYETLFPVIRFTVEVGGKLCSGNLSYSIDTLPRTTEVYLDIVTKTQKAETILKILQDMQDPNEGVKEMYGSVYVSLPDGTILTYEVNEYRDYENNVRIKGGREPSDISKGESDGRIWKERFKDKEMPSVESEDLLYLVNRYKDNPKDLSKAIVIISLNTYAYTRQADGNLFYANDDDHHTITYYLFADPEEFL